MTWNVSVSWDCGKEDCGCKDDCCGNRHWQDTESTWESVKDLVGRGKTVVVKLLSE